MYCQVTVKGFSKQGERHFWFVLKSEHASLGDLNRTLAQTGTLYGERIETVHEDGGVRRVRDRYETIVTRENIVSICEMQSDLLDEDGAPLWTFDRGEVA